MKAYVLILLMALFLGCVNIGGIQNQTPQLIPIVNCAERCGNASQPVCGSDGMTYGSGCLAGCAGAAVSAEGECATAPAPGCTDTDSGQDIYHKGTARQGNTVQTDTCRNPTEITEYYCEGNQLRNITMACAQGFSCGDGACVKSAATGCQDNDGADIYKKGSVTTAAGIYEDTCNDAKIVKEYECAGDTAVSSLHECPSGYRCEAGRCMKPSSECRETDAGNDIYTAGTLTIQVGLTNAEYMDKCIDAKTLKEYYCTGDTYTSELVTCPEDLVCAQDACKRPVCSDTDGGNDIFRKGMVNKGPDSYEDSCTDSEGGAEYFCEDNNVKSFQFTCPMGYVCNEGRCTK